MKILIDDERTTLPDGSEPDIIARTFDGGVALLNVIEFGSRDELYLDHDLGDPDIRRTGYALARIIEERAACELAFVLPRRIVCVSANVPGAEHIEAAIRSAYAMRGDSMKGLEIDREKD